MKCLRQETATKMTLRRVCFEFTKSDRLDAAMLQHFIRAVCKHKFALLNGLDDAGTHTIVI